MKSKKNKFLITSVICLVTLFSITYFSCEKVGTQAYCDGVACQNGGYCNKGQCMCLTGYEGAKCDSSVVLKYFGTWDVDQRLWGSDSGYVHDSALFKTYDSTYQIQIKPTATPTTFFINNFMGNYEYNKLVCGLDAINSFVFTFDSTANAAMWLYPIFFQGGHGHMSPTKDTIYITYWVKYINNWHNWQNDSFKIRATPHRH